MTRFVLRSRKCSKSEIAFAIECPLVNFLSAQNNCQRQISWTEEKEKGPGEEGTFWTLLLKSTVRVHIINVSGWCDDDYCHTWKSKEDDEDNDHKRSHTSKRFVRGRAQVSVYFILFYFPSVHHATDQTVDLCTLQSPIIETFTRLQIRKVNQRVAIVVEL